jgi:hypothetical protein
MKQGVPTYDRCSCCATSFHKASKRYSSYNSEYLELVPKSKIVVPKKEIPSCLKH